MENVKNNFLEVKKIRTKFEMRLSHKVGFEIRRQGWILNFKSSASRSEIVVKLEWKKKYMVD